MMKAEELMIGNYIEVNLEIKACTVIWEVSHIVGESVLYKPIPITEEWLLKFGFKKDIKYKNTFYVAIEVLNGVSILSIDIRANVLLVGDFEIGDFKYIHQLQNLCFAFGKKLELKQ